MTSSDVIVNQRRALMIYADRHGISQACRVFHVSRTSFYKLKAQWLKTGSLAPQVRRRPKMPNEMGLSNKKLLLKLVQQHPSWGPRRYAAAFRQEGIAITGEALWRHLKRFGLNRRFQRLVYLERLQGTHQPVTERTLRRVRQSLPKLFQGLWPGHIVALDTFYVGHLKGVGRIYQMTGIDLCSRYGWAKCYTNLGQDASIDLVENVLLPKFYANGVQLESVLTDNGTEFTGGRFQRMLGAYDIAHLRIPKGKPILNGTCERFQRTIAEEFYQPQFRQRFFRSLQDLQLALDSYLTYYNFQRLHFGLSPNGLIPSDVLKAKQHTLRHRFKKLLT
jgi:transposase InsO family protein